MDRAEILERLGEVVQEQMGLAEAPAESATFASMEMDSLDHVEVAMAVEEEFGIELEDEEIESAFATDATVGKLLDIVEKKVEKREG